jgi:hypothetical protein
LQLAQQKTIKLNGNCKEEGTERRYVVSDINPGNLQY